MNTTIRHLILLSSLLAAVYVACTGDKPVSAIEVTNGDCNGRILNPYGSPAVGAIVRLIPEGFTPASLHATTIDSTFTDSNGIYVFDVSDSRYYNLIAEKASASGMRDSIYLQPDSAAHLDDLILKESGWLTGRLTLKEGSDPTQAIILMRGTDIYTIPESDGTFRTPLLPQGILWVRIFTTEEGYAVFDTFVVINEGAETELLVTLPSTDAPTVGGLSAEFDGALMYYTLNWVPPDTTLIVSYRISRRHADGTDTSFLVSKSSRSFTDDVVLFEDDTLTYRIAAIALNYREGYSGTFPVIVPRSPIVLFRTTEIKYPEDKRPVIEIFSLANNDDVIMGTEYTIRRFSQDGNPIARYDVPEEKSRITGYDEDGDGNIYCSYYNSVDDRDMLLKLNDALELQRQVICTIPEYSDDYQHLEAARNGTVYFSTLLDTGEQGALYCAIYDSSLTFTGEIFRELSISIPNDIRIGDIVVARYYDDPGPDDFTEEEFREFGEIMFFDYEYNLLRSFSEYSFFSPYLPPDESEELPGMVDIIHVGPGGTIIAYVSHLFSYDEVNRITIMVTDGQGHMLARKLIRPAVMHDTPQFDRSGNIYFRRMNSLPNAEIQDWTIFGYTTDWLFSVK
ncbi:MAG: carboxypeptidase regulatory-like domain-containing protein [Chitinispirillaceae bacterium]|nr:carboxypeptidase regulatory-like domain-containing protein [Chitinispirillaceae bacterium]